MSAEPALCQAGYGVGAINVSVQQPTYIDLLPIPLQRLHEHVCWRVGHARKFPDEQHEPLEWVKKEASTRIHRLHVAILQGRVVKGAGDIQGHLILFIGKVRERGMQARGSENKASPRQYDHVGFATHFEKYVEFTEGQP